MMVDRAKCDTLLGLLAGYVGELRRLAAIPAVESLEKSAGKIEKNRASHQIQARCRSRLPSFPKFGGWHHFFGGRSCCTAGCLEPFPHAGLRLPDRPDDAAADQFRKHALQPGDGFRGD